jgi:hypothetical protein
LIDRNHFHKVENKRQLTRDRVIVVFVCLFSLRQTEINRYSIDCYSQAMNVVRPRSLTKLEQEKQKALNNDEGTQFTVRYIFLSDMTIDQFVIQLTSADGTTLIVSYDYVSDQYMNELEKKMQFDVKNKDSPHTTVPSTLSNNVERQFLVDFFSGQQCLTAGSGWWHYEICYGKHVKQYHVNSHSIHKKHTNNDPE